MMTIKEKAESEMRTAVQAERTACAEFSKQEKPQCFLGTECLASLFYFRGI